MCTTRVEKLLHSQIFFPLSEFIHEVVPMPFHRLRHLFGPSYDLVIPPSSLISSDRVYKARNPQFAADCGRNNSEVTRGGRKATDGVFLRCHRLNVTSPAKYDSALTLFEYIVSNRGANSL